MTEKKLKKTEQALEREHARNRLLTEMTRHIGKSRIIGMGELFEKVFGESWSHRINDTKRLRDLITMLRLGDGETPPVAICSSCSANGPGYYLAQTGPELQAYIDNIQRQALRKLVQAARLRKIPLVKLLGQLALDLQTREQTP